MARGKRFTHREFVYTGNHVNGKNTIYQNGQQELMQYIGLLVDREGLNQYNFFGELGETREATYKGFRVQLLRATGTEGDGFGYEYTHIYRVEKLNA